MQRHDESKMAGVSTDPLEWDQWLYAMELLWQNGAKEKLVHRIAEAFQSVRPTDLHAFVLHILDKSQDLRRMKPVSLGLVVLQEFTQWMHNNRHLLPKDLSGIITDGMKLHAIRLATSAHINLFDKINNLYHLRCHGNEFLATHLRVLLARKQFKEAGVCVHKLQLQHCFKIEEICLPLVLQDKVNLVERYIQESKEAQTELIQRLDSLCGSPSYRSQVIDELNVPGTRKEKLRPKNLSKLIVRLAKQFKLDLTLCPNTTYQRDLAAVRYLLYKKYIEQTLDAENWDELVSNAIGDNKPLQEEFITQLTCYNDPQAAAKWAVHFGIDQTKLTAAVLGEIEKQQACPPPSDEAENWDDELLEAQMLFYQLRLPLEHIIMVDTAELLGSCSKHIIQEDQIVGIDMEWTPSFTATHITRVAVVQLATMDHVYLLDMLALMHAEAENLTTAFFQNFLSSSKVLKLGFGIKGDFQMLSKSYPSLKKPISDVQRMVDLLPLSKQVVQAQPDILKSATETNSPSPNAKGLSELTWMCFGQTLDKKEQLSNWERRPLRPSQTQYAALDAFCLLEIYSFLIAKVSDAQLDVNMEPPYSGKTPPKRKSKTKTKTKESKCPKNKVISGDFKKAGQESAWTLRPRDLSVVCDTMLQGLGKQLRACGVDVKILETSDEHDEAAKIAFREKRIILTAGTPYHTLKSQVGEGRCMAVDTARTARQQAAQVLQYYHIRVKQEDIFSRCQACNTDCYVQVNREDMRRLWQRKKELLEAEGRSDASSKSAECNPATAAAAAAAPAPAAASASAKYLTHPLHDYDSDNDDTGLCLGEDFDDDLEAGGGDFYAIAAPASYAKSPQTSWSSVRSGVASNSSDISVPKIPTSKEGIHSASNTAASRQSQMTNFQNDELYGCLNSLEDEADMSSPKDSSRSRMSNYKPPTDGQLEGTVDFDKVTVGDCVPLQVELIPEGIVDKVQNFFCCSGCGKAFWEGTHFDRVVTQFSHVLDFSSEPNL